MRNIDKSLIEAIAADDLPAVQAALRAGASVEGTDEMGRTALYHAAAGKGASSLAIAEALLVLTANPNQADSEGETPLIAAVQNRNYALATRLLEDGADINMQEGKHLQSALHWALHADLRDKETGRVLWLLQQGASTELRNDNGRTVFDLAREYQVKWPEAGEILRVMIAFDKEAAFAVAAREMQEKEDLRASIDGAFHGGLKQEIAVRPLRLKKPLF